MTHQRAISIFLIISGFGIGQGLSSVSAAPGEIAGSPNIAVDVYRNSAGTFILWSDGRLTNANGSTLDLGKPYQDPPAAANIGRPTRESEGNLGAPEVAVQSLSRPDGTYILFGDGRLRRPSNSDAAAGASSQQGNIIAGSWRGGSSTEPGKYSVSVSGNELRINLSQPISGQYHAWAAGMPFQQSQIVPYTSTSGSGGSSIVFQQKRALNDPSPDGYFFIVGEQ